MKAYLQHGAGKPDYNERGEFAPHPRSTEEVPHQIADQTPVNRSRTGYGSQIPTEHLIKWLGLWRRVYLRIYSNAGTLYIKHKGERIVVTLDEGGE